MYTPSDQRRFGLVVTADDILAQFPTAVSHQEFVRPVLKAIPNKQEILKKISLPLGLIVNNFAPKTKKRQSVPLLKVFDSKGLRCKICAGYLNPFVTYIGNGRQWRCNFCHALNNVPDNALSSIDPMTGLLNDICSRPELTYGTIDIQYDQSLFKSRPQALSYCFIIDTSHFALKNGLLKTITQSISDSLDEILQRQLALNKPIKRNNGFERVRDRLAGTNVSIITYNKENVTVYELKDDILVAVKGSKTKIKNKNKKMNKNRNKKIGKQLSNQENDMKNDINELNSKEEEDNEDDDDSDLNIELEDEEEDQEEEDDEDEEDNDEDDNDQIKQKKNKQDKEKQNNDSNQSDNSSDSSNTSDEGGDQKGKQNDSNKDKDNFNNKKDIENNNQKDKDNSNKQVFTGFALEPLSDTDSTPKKHLLQQTGQYQMQSSPLGTLNKVPKLNLPLQKIPQLNIPKLDQQKLDQEKLDQQNLDQQQQQQQQQKQYYQQAASHPRCYVFPESGPKIQFPTVVFRFVYPLWRSKETIRKLLTEIIPNEAEKDYQIKKERRRIEKMKSKQINGLNQLNDGMNIKQGLDDDYDDEDEDVLQNGSALGQAIFVAQEIMQFFPTSINIFTSTRPIDEKERLKDRANEGKADKQGSNVIEKECQLLDCANQIYKEIASKMYEKSHCTNIFAFPPYSAASQFSYQQGYLDLSSL
ncbi:MAG: putative protein transport protein SEC24, partial [Streblomastix strix]